MQIGDLVQCVEPILFSRLVGLIVKIIPRTPMAPNSYEVLVGDGEIRVYTAAAVRSL